MKPNTLRVKAAFEDRPVFMPRRRMFIKGEDRYIIGNLPVVVPNTRYYQKRLAMGDLVMVVEQTMSVKMSKRDSKEK